jgi:hypothetical protein
VTTRGKENAGFVERLNKSPPIGADLVEIENFAELLKKWFDIDDIAFIFELLCLLLFSSSISSSSRRRTRDDVIINVAKKRKPPF